MKSFKLFLEGLSSKERADIKAALDDGKTVLGKSRHIEGEFKILKFTTLVTGVNRIPRALIDDGNKEKYIDTRAIDSFKINESTKEGKGLWHNIHQKRKRGEKMRKKGEKGAPTNDAIKKASGNQKGTNIDLNNPTKSVPRRPITPNSYMKRASKK